MLARLLPFALAALPALAGAQFIPPIPKRVAGDTKLERRGPIPLPAENQSWIRVRTPRFTIISSANERRTREVAQSLEALAVSLRQVNERFDGSSIDTRVLLFARRRDSQAFFDLLLNRKRAESPGVFVGHPNGSGTMVIDAGREWDRTLFHELIHNLLAGSGAHLPLWLEEGIAEYFSTAAIKGNNIVIGHPIREHLRVLWSRSLLPLKDVLDAPRTSPLITHVMFYPQCWGTVAWMMRSNRRAFYSLLTDVEAGMSASAALLKHYHLDERAIDRAIRKPDSVPFTTISVPLESVEGSTTVEDLARADALSEIGSFLGVIEVSAPDAERFFNAALQLDPSHGRAIAGLANLRARQRNYEEAYPIYERALKASPDDPVVLLDFAEALMRNRIGTFAGVPGGGEAPVHVRRARELARRALNHGGDLARANAVLGSSYLVEEDVGPGIIPLEKALDLRPSRSDVALNLYTLYLRSGDRAHADALFERRFARSRNPQVTFAARTIFVQEQLTIVNRSIARNELENAQTLVKELIELTSDPMAKLDLQNQLRDLERTAAINAQIHAYNAAVGVANGGKTEEALKMVNDLLQRATDETVIADATRLREMLEWKLRRLRRSRE